MKNLVFDIKKIIHAKEQDRADVVEKRIVCKETQSSFRAETLVFLDESGVNTDLAHRYGRAKGEKRVRDAVPLNTPKNPTVLSSVRLNGETVSKPFSGAQNGKLFL